jgi:predicted enzyme related to lactoylglutathione lyase
MFQGLRTVIYNPTDLDKGKAWYRTVLGIDPYFDEPFYVGFNVGGYELGLNPGAPKPANDAGVVAYWGVADIDAAHKRIIELGAREHSPVEDVGGDIRVSSVLDPFGNLIGLIQNPHFKVEDGQ